MNREKILFVDDDANLLDSYRRQLRKKFRLTTAQGGQEALEQLKQNGTFAVVVSDMRMPGMDGIQVLTEVRKRSPDSVRMMLTGNADLQTAIDAVNAGSVFRFLTKPCSPDNMSQALEEGLRQYQLIHAEKDLLEKTLHGSVFVLSEILSLVNPTAFSRSNRIKAYAKHIASRLNLSDIWKFEVAAMLSQIGCVTLPPIILNKIYCRRELSFMENKMFSNHPKVGCKLLANIPRMEQIAKMIEGQQIPYKEHPPLDSLTPEDIISTIGAQILKVALEFDQLVIRAVSPEVALNVLRKRRDEYNPKILDTMKNFTGDQVEVEVKEITVKELEIGMVMDAHVKSKKGTLLVPTGHEVTFPVLERIRNFAHGGMGVREPLRVRVPLQELFKS